MPPAGGPPRPGAFQPPPRPVATAPKKGGAGKWVLLALLGGAVFCCGGGIILVVVASKEVAKVDPLKAACLGTAVAGAPAYQRGAALQKVAAFRRSGTAYTIDFDLVPRDWRAESVAESPLVLCAEEPASELVERCAYDGIVRQGVATLERWGYRRELRLVEASTGREVARTTLQGAAARPCADRESFGSTSTQRRYGQPVSPQQVQEWLGPQVLPSGAAPAAAPTGPAPVVPLPAAPPTVPMPPAGGGP